MTTSGFTVYNGSNAVGDWCQGDSCSDYCKPGSVINNTTSCKVYIRANKTANAFGSPLTATLTVITPGSQTQFKLTNMPVLYAAGNFKFAADGSTADGIAQWKGSTWTQLRGGGLIQTNDLSQFFNIYTLAIDEKGILYAGGLFDQTAAGLPVNHVAQWTGSEWLSVGSGFNTEAHRLFYYDGILYAGGPFTETGDSRSVQSVAYWDGTQWQQLGTNPPANAASSHLIFNFKVNGDYLYTAGQFTQLLDGSTDANRIARYNFNTGEWSALPDNNTNNSDAPQNTVQALAFNQAGTMLYVGGNPKSPPGLDSFFTSFDLSSQAWSRIPTFLQDLEFYKNKAIKKLVVRNDGFVYACGGFRGLNDANNQPIAHTEGIARYNISTGQWQSVGDGAVNLDLLTSNDLGDDLYLDTDNALYFAGSFTEVENTGSSPITARGIARWDNGAWTSLGGGVWAADSDIFPERNIRQVLRGQQLTVAQIASTTAS